MALRDQYKMSGVFFLISFSLNSIALCIFKYLSLLQIPISMFVCFLLTGFPLGGILSIYLLKKENALRRSLMIAVVIILLSFVTMYYCFRFNFIVEDWLFDRYMIMDQYRVLCLIGLFLFDFIMFLPFFVAYGSCEFICYKKGVKLFNDVRLVYFIFIGGVSASFLFFRHFLEMIGIMPIVIISLAVMLMLLTYLSSFRKGLKKRMYFCLAALLFSCFFNLNLDSRTVSLLLQRQKNDVEKIVYEKWNKYCLLTITNQGSFYAGAYNNLEKWVFPKGSLLRRGLDRELMNFEGAFPHLLELALFQSLDDCADIAILGAGGGMQVKMSLIDHPCKVVAVEIVPAVIDTLKYKLNEEFEGIYNANNVKIVPMDGRKYLEKVSEKFDLIYVGSPSTSISTEKTILESHYSLSTIEGIKTIKDHLKPDGVLVFLQDGFFRYYFSILKKIGFDVSGYTNKKADADSFGYTYLIIAKLSQAKKTVPDDEEKMLLDKYGFKKITDMPSVNDILTLTDDQPLKGLLLLDLIDPKVVYLFLYTTLILFLILLSGILIRMKKVYYSCRITSKTYYSVSTISFFVGVNFILMENVLIYTLYHYLNIPLDAMYIGIILFLFFAGISKMIFIGTEKSDEKNVFTKIPKNAPKTITFLIRSL